MALDAYGRALAARWAAAAQYGNRRYRQRSVANTYFGCRGELRFGLRVQPHYQRNLYFQYSIDFIFHFTKLALNSTKSSFNRLHLFPDSSPPPNEDRYAYDSTNRQCLVVRY